MSIWLSGLTWSISGPSRSQWRDRTGFTPVSSVVFRSRRRSRLVEVVFEVVFLTARRCLSVADIATRGVSKLESNKCSATVVGVRNADLSVALPRVTANRPIPVRRTPTRGEAP